MNAVVLLSLICLQECSNNTVYLKARNFETLFCFKIYVLGTCSFICQGTRPYRR